MLVAFDWVDKLRPCESSKKESRLIFTLNCMKLWQRVLLRLALAQKLLEAFYLPLEFATHLSRYWRCLLWISRSRFCMQPSLDHLASVVWTVIFGAVCKRLVDLSLAENDWSLLETIIAPHTFRIHVVHEYALQHFLNLRNSDR